MMVLIPPSWFVKRDETICLNSIRGDCLVLQDKASSSIAPIERKKKIKGEWSHDVGEEEQKDDEGKDEDQSNIASIKAENKNASVQPSPPCVTVETPVEHNVVSDLFS